MDEDGSDGDSNKKPATLPKKKGNPNAKPPKKKNKKKKCGAHRSKKSTKNVQNVLRGIAAAARDPV